MLGISRWIQSDKTGEIGVFRSESVEAPGTEGGPHKLKITRVHLGLRLGMIRHVRVHPFQHAKVVGMFGKVRKKLRHPQTTLSMLLEFPGRTENFRSAIGIVRPGFAVVFVQLRFVVEGVEMGGCSLHG